MAPRKLFTSARSSPILGSNNDRDELARLAKQNGVFSWSNFTRSFSCDFTGKLSIIFVYDTFTCLNFCYLLKATSSQCGRIASQGMTFQNKIWTQAYFEHVHRNNHIQFENHRFHILIVSAGGPKLQTTRALRQVAGMSLWVLFYFSFLPDQRSCNSQNCQKLM